MNEPIFSASILSADFAKLGQETNDAIAAGINNIHFDVMDHHFVPNLSFGPVVCRALRHAGIEAPIDVHLMVDSPEQYFKPFAEAGANLITFHPETAINLEDALQQLRDLGMQTGVAFNPNNGVEITEDILQSLDLVLLMSVNPGFGGQPFINGCLDKIAATRKQIEQSGSGAYLGADGGIKIDNIGKVAKAGADFFVVGSGLFHADDYKERVNALRAAL